MRIEPAVKLKLAFAFVATGCDTVGNDQREFTTLKNSLGMLEAFSHFACTSSAERGNFNIKVARKRAEDASR